MSKQTTKQVENDDNLEIIFVEPDTYKVCPGCSKKPQPIENFIGKNGKEHKSCEKCRFRSRKSNAKRRAEGKVDTKEWKIKNAERYKQYLDCVRKGIDWEQFKKDNNIQDHVVGFPSSQRKEHIFINELKCKECSHCKQILSLDNFNKSSKSWDELRHECKKCLRNYRRHPHVLLRITIYNQLYWILTKEKQLLRNKKWKLDNKEYYLAYMRSYIKNWEADQRATNPVFVIKKSLRTRVWHALRDQNAVKYKSTLDLLGCTPEFLWEHLEKQFTSGMTRENYGKWHVDHIKPCSKFDLTKEEEQKKCFHYTNLQPLWAFDNISKSDKYEETEDNVDEEIEDDVNEDTENIEDDIIEDFDEEDMENLILDITINTDE